MKSKHLKILRVVFILIIIGIIYYVFHGERMHVINYNVPLDNRYPVPAKEIKVENMYQDQDLDFLGVDVNNQKAILMDIQNNSKKGRDVHASNIQKTLSDNFKKQKSDGRFNLSELLAYYPPETHKVIKELNERNVGMVMYQNKKERDILMDIHRNGNQNVRGSLSIILSEMSREGLQCSTGNVSRLLEATYVENPEAIPLDDKTLNKIMLDRSSMLTSNGHSWSEVRNKLMAEYSQNKNSEKIIDSWGLDE